MSHLQLLNRDRLSKITYAHFKRAQIPKRTWERKLGDVPKGTPEGDFVHAYCDEIYDRIVNGQGVHLTGDPGLGKTTLACIIAKYAMLHQATVLYATGEQYFEGHMKDHVFDEDDRETFTDRARNVNLLILDNPSTAGDSKFAVGKIRSLLKDRSNEMLPTILVTDVPWDDPDWVGDLSRDRSIFESCPLSLILQETYWGSGS